MFFKGRFVMKAHRMFPSWGSPAMRMAGTIVALLSMQACNGSTDQTTSAGSGGAGGSGGSSTTVDHCTSGYEVDSRDAQLTGDPV